MINILSLGAGVQSSAIVYLAHAGKIPTYDKIYFADTGDEPQSVYDHVEYLKTLCEIETVRTKSEKSLSEHLLDASMTFFSMPLYVLQDGKRTILKRQCTNEFKIVPIDLAVRTWLVSQGYGYKDSIGRRYINREIRVNYHLGISIDEKRRVSLSRSRWKVHQYPLIELGMTRHDCIRFAISNGYKIPPKSSCIMCPYHTDDYWLSLTSDELERACMLDDYIRTDEFKSKIKTLTGELFIHSSCQPLRAIAASGFKTKIQHPVQLSFAAELLELSCKSDAGFTCFS